jgi:ubiquinone/menaquinone biosynthesis C-methylase UbiE
MKAIEQCAVKDVATLAREWDRLAEERHRQISSGDDLSFHHVIVPTTNRLLQDVDGSVVLDIGSGTGDFTLQLAKTATNVVAIEPSSKSMALARRICGAAGNVQFVEAALEDVSNLTCGPATAAVAVMTLMTVPDLREFAKVLARLLRPEARFVAVMTHPCFWPKYWGYDTESWFRYESEVFIEAPFVISRCGTDVRTTHIHRPLHRYLGTFADEGFALDAVVEPMPGPEVQGLYPRRWAFPRFLGLRWKTQPRAGATIHPRGEAVP